MATEENARITSTWLGREDHGIFTAYIELEFGGAMQSFGGYGLDAHDPDTRGRIGRPQGIEFLAGVLRATGVDRWESLVGTLVRVRRENGLIVAIGHIVEDRWFAPKTDIDWDRDREPVA
jgi:hypothetical protein